MLEIEIDGNKLTVPQGSTVMDAAHEAGAYIPHFCYHKKLSIAANCRMCLVEVEKAPKPLPACATPVTDGMKVHTHSPMAVKAQKGVMEFLLINHPLDCPICDQGGECQLQDLAVGYGSGQSRYQEAKRVVKAKDMMLFSMANAGLPATSGFVGEFLVILGAIQVNFWYGALAGTTLVFGAGYTLWMFKRVIFGAVANAHVAELKDVNKREFLVLGLLALMVLGMGLYPQAFIDKMHPAVNDLIAHVAQSKL